MALLSSSCTTAIPMALLVGAWGKYLKAVMCYREDTPAPTSRGVGMYHKRMASKPAHCYRAERTWLHQARAFDGTIYSPSNIKS